MSIEENQYRIGLSFVAKVTPALVRRMAELDVDAEEFFKLDASSLSDRLGLSGARIIKDAEREEALARGRREADFVERHNIRVYSLLDSDYPFLLGEIPDAPIVLYQLGSASLDGDRMLAMVGTRRATPYGTHFCESVVEGLAHIADLKIVSGLAYGIDTASHEAALRHDVPTIGVVAHGLDMIYPSQNRELARRMIERGGALISQYPSGSTPYAGRFLERNRIVAGLCQLTLVAESPAKGGAMSTANLAFSYNREVAALPGRSCDEASAGCNRLIKTQKAHLVESAADVLKVMGWQQNVVAPVPVQKNLFPELDEVGGIIYEIIKSNPQPTAIDEIHMRSKLSVSQLMAILTELEFDGLISRLPGNRFSLC